MMAVIGEHTTRTTEEDTFEAILVVQLVSIVVQTLDKSKMLGGGRVRPRKSEVTCADGKRERSNTCPAPTLGACRLAHLMSREPRANIHVDAVYVSKYLYTYIIYENMRRSNHAELCR